MIFVDTSAWFAAYVPTDPNHSGAAQRLGVETDLVVTTDFVIDESITLLLARRERQRAINFGRDLLITAVARIEMVTLADMVQAYDVFCRFRDKSWSFTDCTSYVVMRRLNIAEALAFDEHFRQMPGIAVIDVGT